LDSVIIPQTWSILDSQGVPHTPYLPQFCSKLDSWEGKSFYNPGATSLSAGTECSGLTHNAATYASAHYKIKIENHHLWTGNNEHRNPLYTWKIAAGAETTKDNYQLIVPGDWFCMDGHVAIVLKIEYDYSEGKRKISEPYDQKITFIDATSGSDTRGWRVMNQMTIRKHGGVNYDAYEFRRLVE
jgi:hypothetical protein